MNRTSLFTAGAFLAGGLVGAAVGFKLAERRLMGEFEEAVEHERSSIAAMYAARQPYASPQEAVEDLMNVPEVIEAVESTIEATSREPVAYHKIKPSSVQVQQEEKPEPPAPVQEKNIFEDQTEPPEIYVISQLEYEHGGGDNEKASLMWYVEDSVLADVSDDTFDVPEDVVGNCLNHFGLESDDKNTVYVRNTKIAVDYEITRDPGSYWRSVHGMEPAEARPSQNGG